MSELRDALEDAREQAARAEEEDPLVQLDLDVLRAFAKTTEAQFIPITGADHRTPSPPREYQGVLRDSGAQYAGAQYAGPSRQWSDIEAMGYTPLGVKRLIENHAILCEQRVNLVRDNNYYIEQNRHLRRHIDHLDGVS